MTRFVTRGDGREVLAVFEFALPRRPTETTTRLVLDVMRHVSRAATASLYREREGELFFVAGEGLKEAALRPIRAALRHRREGVPVSSIWVAEPGGDGWERSWVLWSERPHDAERDVVYMQGPKLRPPAECSEQLQRLIGLLGPLP